MLSDALEAPNGPYPPQPCRDPLTRRCHRDLTTNRHPALRKAGVPVTRNNGTHALRHFYASALLDGGESIRAVSEYLGHADPGFTLRTYTHLMQSSAERTRKAIDVVFDTETAAADLTDIQQVGD